MQPATLESQDIRARLGSQACGADSQPARLPPGCSYMLASPGAFLAEPQATPGSSHIMAGGSCLLERGPSKRWGSLLCKVRIRSRAGPR